MSADISRVRFDPLRDFSGVVLQQGRLLLDADFNEYVALLDRRLRAETVDLTSFGPDPDQAGESWVPRQTPDAFRVTASGGKLTIGRGRMYVDGLLAENHGDPANGFDPLLRERTGTADTPYDKQPYWPTPDALPGGGPHLAYLDVWQREVTALEDPNLVEIAVGVDTTARTQTVWQVRLLPNTGNATCESDDDEIPKWLDTIAPSAGRLTTGTIDVADDDDPCELPPEGGYRGLENQTYRVEVHDGGAPGTATFKWSRDNGSVAIPVVEMVSTTVLRLSTVGKDDVLRVSTNDWVEILDDHYELNQKPGVMRKVTVDDAERTITFTGAIPTDLRPANADDAAKRHLRVRRWDQAGAVKDGAGNQLTDLDASGVERTDHRAVELGDAGRARARRRRLVLDRVGRKRQVPSRRPLDLRRAHRRRFGRGARPRAAARHPAPLRAARLRHVPRLADRLPAALAAARRRRRRLRVHALRQAGRASDAPGSGRPDQDDRRHDLPRARRLRPRRRRQRHRRTLAPHPRPRARDDPRLPRHRAHGPAVDRRHRREPRGDQRLRGAGGDRGAQRRRRDAAGPRRPVVPDAPADRRACRRGRGRALGRRALRRDPPQHPRRRARRRRRLRRADRPLRRGAARRGQRRRRAAARDRPRRPLGVSLLVPRRAQRHPRRETAAASSRRARSRRAGRST